MARPRKAEKMNIQSQKDLAREVCYEALKTLKSKISEADAGELGSLVTKLLPIILDGETQTTTDVTLELLAQKSLRVSMRIREANEQNHLQEEIQMPNAIEEVDGVLKE